MPPFVLPEKTASLKIVYYGPAGSGKTTNLQVVHRHLPAAQKSGMMPLSTAHDRSVFFDFLSVELGTIGRRKVLLQLYTVPGAAPYFATRKRAACSGSPPQPKLLKVKVSKTSSCVSDRIVSD